MNSLVSIPSANDVYQILRHVQLMPEMYAIQIIAYESYDMSLPLGDSFTNFTLCLFVPF